MRIYIKIMLILLIISGSLALDAEGNLNYGDQVTQIFFVKTDGTKIELLKSKKLNFLVFFNVLVPSHWRTLTEIDQLIQDLKKKGCELMCYAISSSDPAEFEIASKTNRSSFILLNDISNKIHDVFEFDCGQCLKFIVIDSGKILRYNASYVDLYVLKQVLTRYCIAKEK